ncbi:MAG: F-type H+/Na+-transporting ATPase subunit beta [Actinomycetota bacterium]|jgi:F0F1-type ATP synthase beta subunit
MTDHEALLGRVYAPGELDLGATAPSVARPAVREPISTGLKVIDAIAPIARGGTIEMVGPAGTGHLVLVVELTYRLNRSERDSAIVAVGSSRQAVSAGWSLDKLVTEPHEHDRHAVILSDDDDGATLALRDGDQLARGLAGAGVDVLLVVDKETCTAVGGPTKLKDLAGLSSGGGSVTLVLLDPYARDAALPPDAGMETRLVFTADHLALGIFPALDPVESRSTFDNSDVADEVRRLLRASNEVRRYFNQPMVVAESHTGEPPTWVDRADADDALRQLLAASA